MSDDNPYKMKEPMSEEQWIAILGPDEFTEVENRLEVWEKIKDLEPYEVTGSLHIAENRFELDGVKYRCLWSYNQKEEEPFEISIITPLKMGYKQHELF